MVKTRENKDQHFGAKLDHLAGILGHRYRSLKFQQNRFPKPLFPRLLEYALLFVRLCSLSALLLYQQYSIFDFVVNIVLLDNTRKSMFIFIYSHLTLLFKTNLELTRFHFLFYVFFAFIYLMIE